MLDIQATRLKDDVGPCWPNEAAVGYGGKHPMVQFLADLMQECGGLSVHVATRVIGFRWQHFEDALVKKHPHWSSAFLIRIGANQEMLTSVSISTPSGNQS